MSSPPSFETFETGQPSRFPRIKGRLNSHPSPPPLLFQTTTIDNFSLETRQPRLIGASLAKEIANFPRKVWGNFRYRGLSYPSSCFEKGRIEISSSNFWKKRNVRFSTWIFENVWEKRKIKINVVGNARLSMGEGRGRGELFLKFLRVTRASGVRLTG